MNTDRARGRRLGTVVSSRLALALPACAATCLLGSPNALARQVEPAPTCNPDRPGWSCEILLPPGFERGVHVTDTWPNGIVPYEFHANVGSNQRQAVKDAMAELEAVAGLNFVERPRSVYRLLIKESNKNASYVGRQPRCQQPQVVQVFNWEHRFIIVHELMHALGFWHTQQRNDRDAFIRIEYDNFDPDCDSDCINANYEVQDSTFDFGTYDMFFDSVMQYHQCQLSRCDDCWADPEDCRTITVLPPYEDWQDLLGQDPVPSYLSDGDIAALQFLYPSGEFPPKDARESLEPDPEDHGGSIVAWGRNEYGQTNVPGPNAGFVAVSAGSAHSLGLKGGGSIAAWGLNNVGQTDVPSPNAGYVAVAAGAHHNLGLKSDGSIVAWGHDWAGQIDVPGSNAGFVAVSAGSDHSLGLKGDGSIVAWGYNIYGQTDVPWPNTGFVAVAGGGYHSLGLKGDGSIVAWGWNFHGQTAVPWPNTGFVAVAAGSEHSLGLKCDGSIVAWGSNDYGQTNLPGPNTGFVAIAGGRYHSLGLKDDGSIVAWGLNNFGQTDVPGPNTGFVAVAGGGFHSLGIRKSGLRGGADSPRADWNRDGLVDARDVVAFFNDWAAGEADFNGDALTDTRDVAEFLNEWVEAR